MLHSSTYTEIDSKIGIHKENKMSSNTIEKVQATVLKEYKAFFKEIKEKILTSQVKAALAVNHELIQSLLGNRLLKFISNKRMKAGALRPSKI